MTVAPEEDAIAAGALPTEGRTALAVGDAAARCSGTVAMGADVRQRWAAADRHRAQLVSLARRRLGTLADAEDCVSEAILRTATFENLDEDRLPQFLYVVTS